MHDTIIIGAGAAGLMTAIVSAQNGVGVLLLDGQAKIGAKILMSGGTRCNVTNKIVNEKDYNSNERMRVRNILRGFDNQRTIRFFNELGLTLDLEPTGKYFPITNNMKGGQAVLNALLGACKTHNVEIQTHRKVCAIHFENELFTVKGEEFSYQAKSVVLTTGGLSYPSTGSDGVGFRIAQSFGHRIIETSPALTPMTTNDQMLKSLSGISLPVTLTLFEQGKKKISMSDDFLFTHFGFSGPVALDMSRHVVQANKDRQLFANFIVSHTAETFEQHLLVMYERQPRKLIDNILIEFLPQRLVAVLLEKCKIVADLPINQLGKVARKRLIECCMHYPLVVSGVVGYSKAEVTAGGVDLSEVNSKSLESNFRSNLFFAGEILDVDGRIGGFNFQWAWASGHCVAMALAGRYRKEQ